MMRMVSLQTQQNLVHHNGEPNNFTCLYSLYLNAHKPNFNPIKSGFESQFMTLSQSGMKKPPYFLSFQSFL